MHLFHWCVTKLLKVTFGADGSYTDWCSKITSLEELAHKTMHSENRLKGTHLSRGKKKKYNTTLLSFPLVSLKLLQ